MDLNRNLSYGICPMALLYKISLTGDTKALWKILLFKYNLVLTVLIWSCAVLLLMFVIVKIKKKRKNGSS